MLLTSFLHQLKRLGNRILSPSYSVSRDHQRHLPQRLRARGSQAESLEVRTLLAAVAWDGGGDGSSWTDPLNWDNDSVPGASDDVTVDSASVSLSTSVVLNSFNLSNATIFVGASVGFSLDQIDLGYAGNIVAVSDVSISTKSSGRAIVVGGTGSTTELGLSETELTQITAGTLRIGSSDSGNLSYITSSSGSASTLELISGGSISGGSFSVTNLSLMSGSDVTLSADVQFLAISATGHVTYSNSEDVTITDVNGLAGVSAGGDVVVSAGSGTVVVSSSVSGSTVQLTSNDMEIQASVSGSSVVLQPASAGGLISLGAAVFGQLSLDDSELNQVSASTLTVGRSTSGLISVGGGIGYAGNLSLISGGGVTISSPITLSDDQSFSVTSSSTSAGISLASSTADIVTSGDGGVTLTAARNISMASGSSVTTVNGGITMSANAGGISGNFAGISIDAGTIQTTGTGSISLTGKGGADAASAQHHGVSILNGGVVASTSSSGLAGTISLTGTAGLGTYTGAGVGVIINGSSGIQIVDAASRVSTVGGNLMLSGTGGSGVQYSTGTFIGFNARIQSTGAGQITVLGTGGSDSSSRLHSGVLLWNGGAVESTAAGNVSISGTAGTSLNGSYGVVVTDETPQPILAHASVHDGVLQIQGTGGAGAYDLSGTVLAGGGFAQSTGTGQISIFGVGGPASSTLSGFSYNQGVWLTNSSVMSVNGNVTLNGQPGTGTGIDREGILLTGTAAVSTSGTATIGLVTDSLNVASTASINAGTRNVTIVGRTPGTLVSLGGADILSGSPLTLGLSDAELDRVTAGTLTIGNGSSGAMTVSAAITHANNLTLSTAAAITFNSSVTMAVNKSFTATSSSTTTGISLANSSALITASGSGAVSLSAARFISLASGSTISSVNGSISLDANQQMTATTGNFVGIDATSAVIQTSGTGNVLIRGRAGSDAATGAHHGIRLTGTTVRSTSTATNAGTITLTGVGGSGLGSISSPNSGVTIQASSLVTSVAGDIAITGTGGGGTGSNSYGVWIQTSGIVSGTGAADVAVTGTAGTLTSGHTNIGIHVDGSACRIAGVSGLVTVTGTGGVGTGDYNIGIMVINSAQVVSTGSGGIDVNGFGGTGAAYNFGTYLVYSGAVTASAGLIDVSGRGGTGTGNDNVGLELLVGGRITATGTASIVASGQGGTGGGTGNWGVNVDGSTCSITTVGGSLSLTGTAVATTGTYHNGIVIQNSAFVSTTGAGNVSVSGTSSRGVGVQVHNAARIDTSSTGSVSVTGVGGNATGTAAGVRDGVHVSTGGIIRSTSTASNAGTITIQGTGGSGPTSDSFSRGVILEGNNGTITPVSSVNGNISIVGVGGYQPTRDFSEGVTIVRGGRVDSTGTATITINGTGGTGSSQSFGVLLVDNASRVSSSIGNVTIFGQGGTTSTGSSHGVIVSSNSSVSVSGGATLSITGTGGTGGTDNRGVLVIGTNGLVTSTTGAMIIRGFGGTGTGNLMEGVGLLNSGRITSTGGAPIRIEGTGGSGPTGANIGIECWGSTSLTSNSGPVTLVGVGGTGGGFNAGIAIQNSATVSMTGSAALAATGTGGTGGNDNWGLFVGVGGISTVNGSMSLTGNGIATTQANHAGLVLIQGSVTTSGSGSLLMTGNGTTGSGVHVGDGANIRSTSGAANAGSITVVGSSTHSDGVFVDGYRNATTNVPTYIRSIHGDISVTGTGGSLATDSYVDGVVLWRKGQIEGTDNAVVTINGTGGSGVSWNRGVVISGADSFVKASDQLSITGQGGASTTTGEVLGANFGVRLEDGAVVQSIADSTLINGTGGTGGQFNYGVTLTGASTTLTSSHAAISILGQGGSDASGGSLQHGLILEDGAAITSTVYASITINATAGPGTRDSRGVYVTGANSRIESTATGLGAISIVGRGGATTAGLSMGVSVVFGGKIRSLNPLNQTAITITGTGGAGSDFNYGVETWAAGSDITTISTPLVINGTAGGNGTGHSNIGVSIRNFSAVRATGAGTLTINGNGGLGLDQNHGVAVWDSAEVTAFHGLISMTGTGSLVPMDGNADGIAISNFGLVRETGAGSVELTGSPGSGGTGLNIRDNGAVESFGFGVLQLTADSIDLAPDGTVSGQHVEIQPLTDGTTLEIGGDDDEPGVLGLSANDLLAINASYVGVGSEQTGLVSISGSIYVNGSLGLTSAVGFLFEDDGSLQATSVHLRTTGSGGVVSSSSAAVDIRAGVIYFSNQTDDIGSFARPIRTDGAIYILAAATIDAYLDGVGDWTHVVHIDVGGGLLGLMGGTYYLVGDDVFAPGTAVLLTEGAELEMDQYVTDDGSPPLPASQTLDRLILAAGDIIGNGVITILTELEVREGNIEVELTGPGLVRKTTDGRVNMRGPASYTGQTLIEEGRYWIYDDTSLGATSAGTVVSAGAELYVAGSHVIQEPLVLAGELAIGTFVAGSYVLWEADIELIESEPGVYPKFEANDPPDLLEITGIVSGASGLIISGSGTVIFADEAIYTGPTIVEEGTLAFAVSITGDVELETDATLQTLSPETSISGNLFNSGTVGLGSPHGRLNVGGNYVQSATGSVIVDLEGTSPGVSLDQLDVAGDVTLDGDVNFDTFNAFQSVSGDAIILIRSGGANPIEGDFDNAEEGELVYPGGLGPYQLTYFGGDGNDVELLPLTVYVTATADAGVGSFRQAILDINRLYVPGQILFHIDGTGPFEIQTESALPTVTSSVTIDASPPPDSVGPHSIELIGQAGQPGADPGVNGLEFLSSDSQLIGLSITRFTGVGVYVSGNRMTLRANFIGTNVEGRPGLGNLGHGLVLDEVNDAILGDMDAEEHRNVVSGNLGSGIIVYGGSLTSFGTWVGLAPDGESALGNGQAGMVVSQATLLELQDTVISGNAGDGLRIDDRTLDILIEESRFGVSNSGTRAVGNGGIGLRLDRSDVLTTASQFQIYDSVISDNDAGGLWINDQRTAAGAVVNYDVSFNQFGLNEAGTVGMGNGQFGVKLEGSPVLDVAPGTAHFVGNTASGNDGPGLWLENLRGWSIRESRFGTDSNGLFAIPNDTGLYVHNSSALSSESFVDPGFYHASDYIQASGNRQEGVRIVVDDQTLPIILGEVLIGTDASGTYAIPNSRGISLDMSDNDFTSVGLHGVVSGNLGPGVVVSTTGISYDRLVLNLRVGTDVTGTEPLSNRGSGIVVASDTVNAIIHPESIIAFNRGPGIRHEGIGDGSNIHLGSLSYAVPPVPRVFGNTGLAVDLGAPGPTTNNGTATDHPVILSAVLNSGFLNITGTNSATNAHFIQFYTTRPTVSGRGQGQEVIDLTGRLQGPGFPAGLSNYLNTIGAGPFLEDLLPDAGVFAFQIPVGPDFDARLLTAVTVDPTFGVWPSLSGVSEFSPIIAIGTQLTALPPVVDAGGDTQLFAGDRLTRSVTFRDDDSVEFEVVVDFGDGGGFEYAQYRPADRSIVLDHTYHDTGVYVVSVSVLDDSTPVGLFDIDTFRVTVTNTPPEIRFNEVQLTKRIREGETVDLQGLFDDIGLTDLHTIEVNWGDGIPTTSAYLPIGARSFDVQHTFLDDGVSLADSHVYRVVVTVRDDSGSVSATPVFLVEVDNVLPGWPPLPQVGGDPFVPALELDDNNIVEGESIELSGRFYDPGLIDSHLIYVNWGDGSPREKVSTSAITQAGARRDFRISHVYGDSPANGSTFTISVELSDDDDPYGIITNSLSVTVANAAPVIDSFEAGFSTPEENVLVPVSVVFLDAGREPHIVTINWGDGTPPEVIYTAPGTIFVSPAHTYLQDGFYTATAIVTDRDGAVSDPASVTISVGNLIPELAPIIVAPATTIVEGDEVLLSGSFSDESLLDNPVITVAWDDGTTSTASIDRTNRTWAARHQFVDDDDPANSGSRDFSVVVSLNDGTDVVTRSTTITVQNERPTLSVIPVIDTTTTNPVFRAAAMDRSPEDRLHLMYNWSVTLDGVPLTYILHGPDEIEVVLSDGTASGGGPGGGTIGLGGTIVISVTVADDDGGVSDEWKARIIHGTAGNDRLTISNSDYSTGIARIIVLGLGGNDLLDASGVTAPGRSVVMYGGTGNDLLFDGSGNDLIVLGAGNDSLNIPVDDPRNSFVDGLGDPYSITPNEGGEDEVIAIANSVLEVWDNVGNNTLNFALNHSAISQSFGITFDLSLTVQTSSTQALTHQDVAPASGEPATHFVGALGNFTKLIGSDYGDQLTGASNATVSGGRGADQLTVKAGTINAGFVGGADDDVLTATGTGIASLSFRGDDGADELFNIGTIAGLTFGGGADDDVLTNSGTILSALNFGGDDGIDALRNFGSIASLTFTGGADDDALTNNLAGSITSLNFGGDDGIDALTNFGSIASLTFGGGADDDVLTNRGSITATLNFGGDDGVDILINTGTIASLTFGGGADDDVLTNDSDGSIANLTFIGGADDDVLTNRGSITTTLSFGGDDGSDILTNTGTIANLTFGGDDGSDVLTNDFGGSIASLTFEGGADDDVLTNTSGSLISTLNFGGDDGSDVLLNFGAITATLSFEGDDGADALSNFGTIASLEFNGGADDDVLTNDLGGSIAALNFGGDDGSDVLLNLGTITATLSFGGDDGADALRNFGTIASLEFTGGADDDVLTNNSNGSIAALNFGGDDGSDVLLNLGTITATLNFGGDDGADVLSNRGTIASLVFTGGADDDVLTNDPGGSIASLNFGGDDGVDILLNHGAVTSLTFNGGADDDVFAHLGGLISTLNFGGDDGDDLLVVRGSVQSLTFTGGADDDVLQVSSGLIGSLDFNGDDGDDVLVNRAGGLASLTFTGGADDDILINRGHGLSSLTFIGGDGDDIFVNSGSANVLSPAVLLFEPGEGSNAMRNEGSGWADVRYIGTADTDGLRDENFLQNNGRGLGQLTYISGSGANAFENNASGLTAIAFTGSADDDTFANDGDNVSSILFDGLAGNDTLINTGTRVSDIEFTGGADDDRFINTGEELEHTYFAGGAGDDRVFNRGREVLDFTFIGDEGADWWINEISASGGEELSLLAGDDDDAADVFVNFAANVYGITFDGGVGNDVLQNFGPNSLYFSFFGGTGDDQFLNRGEGAHGFSFDAGDGSDTFENRGRNGGVFSMVGGYGDDTFFQSGGLAYSVELSGDAGRDSLINFSDFVSQLILSGGDDDDLLQNSGQFVSVIILMGGSGSNLLQNFGSDIEWLAILPDGTGTESAHDTLRNSGNRVQSIQVTTDGTATLVSSGSDVGSVLLAGGEHGDVVQLSGTNIAAIEVHGNGGDDSLLLDVNSPVGSSVMFTGGAGSDLLIFRGAVDSLLFDGGADDDLVVFSGTVATAILRGGDDDDQYQFAAAPIGQVTIDEVLTGISATDLSRDLLDFSAFTSGPITLDLALTTPQPQPSPSGGLVLTLTSGLGIEDVIGTSRADAIFGNARDNHLAGAQFLASLSSGTPVVRTKTQWVYLDFVGGLNPGEFPYSPDDIAAIVTRLQEIYGGFDVRFVTTDTDLPDEIEGDPLQFVTITFNETPNTGRPGGEASEIDFGNVNPGGTAVVQVSGLLGGREVLLPLSARVQAVDDGHHDGDRIEAPDVPKPASTSDNFRALSAKIAAHELSHLLGIRHYDAFGPVGFGISAQPGSGEFAPAYPGLIAAFETADHIVSSPASTGTTRFNDLRSLYFGEREAIKLALAFSDDAEVRVDEPAATHDSQATAAPLTLVTLAVPGITGSAFSKDKQLTVTAISVVGDISLGTDGHSASDWYSITGQAGDVVTIEVLSRSLQRYLTDSQTSIDSVVRVFDADGELIQLSGGAALNDDEFESSDSVLMDVRLPAAGTFFIEVDTFRRQPGDPGYDIALARRQELESRRDDANDLTPAEVQLLARLADSLDDTDTGNYELFVYRLTRANQADQADVLKGRGGVDTLIDEPGEDYVIPASITGPNSVAEASLWNGSLNFTDVRGDSWSISINYGDETSTVNGPGAPGSQSLSHSFADNGTYIVTATITNDDGIITSRTFSVTVTNVAPTVTLTGPTTGITGTGLNYSVSASDVAGAADPLSYSWTITRNGSDFTTQSGGLTYSLNASLPGTYRVSVTVNDGDGGVVTRFVDVVVAPAVTPPAVTGFDVNTGLAQRSFIAAVDTVFSTSQLANELLQSLNTATPRVTLTKFSLAGTNGANVPLTTGMSTLPGNATGLRFDFGNRVIGATAAARNAKTADGYYQLAFDLDGNGSHETTRSFYRLLGDVNGDRSVNVTDDNLVRAAIAAYTPPPPKRVYSREADINGDNANNNTDRVSLLRNNKARLGTGLLVDD